MLNRLRSKIGKSPILVGSSSRYSTMDVAIPSRRIFTIERASVSMPFSVI